jgi:myo-inositol-1(or 4)-monophosphatase
MRRKHGEGHDAFGRESWNNTGVDTRSKLKPTTRSRNPAPRAGARARTGAGASDALAREVKLALKAAREAGKILRRYYRSSYEVGSKGRDNPVTTADLEADRTLREMLTRGFPAYGWLSEETADNDDRLGRKRVWIVDPLDGTKEFIKHIPEFSVAIGLVERGRPVLGVTYNPIKGEMYWAARGMGCHLGRRRVRVSRTRSLRRAKVLASRSEVARGEWEVLRGTLRPSPTGSVAYKLAMVAGARGDATFTRSPKSEWDVASGAALIIEAGGSITDLHGRPLRFNRRRPRFSGLVASNGILHQRLVTIANPPKA